LSYCIAGHHTGLPDWYPDEAGSQSALIYRLKNADTKNIPDSIKNMFKAEPHPDLPFSSRIHCACHYGCVCFFSCIVDADFWILKNI
jgi:CRISPR-associated endonuclease/helicase Cas3